MKDVVSCEKPRRVATDIDSGISEWGNPAAKAVSPNRTANGGN